MEMKKCGGGMHWHCCLLPMLGGIMWLVAVVSAVYAWMQMRAGNEAAMGWYYNAIAFGVIALFTKGKRMGSCKMACGGCAGNGAHACGMCK